VASALGKGKRMNEGGDMGQVVKRRRVCEVESGVRRGMKRGIARRRGGGSGRVWMW
jgi:hypothetical protein